MSYILDALKKSEQERKKGTVPGLGTIQGLPARSLGHDGWRRYYFPATLLLLAVLAVFVWLYRSEPLPSQTIIAAPPAPSQPTAPGAAPAPKAALPEKTASPSPAGDERRPVKLTTPPATARPRPNQPLSTPGAPPANPPKLVASPPPVMPPKLKAELPGKRAAIESPLPAALNSPSPFQPPPDTAKPDSSPPPSEEAEVVTKPEDMPVVPLAELPPQIKGIMPGVKITIHFFSDDPVARRAGINGRLLREGQQVEKELILKEITRDGAILAFQGRRFSLAVFPR